MTRRKYVSKDRETVMRMMEAHVEAIHFLKANKEPSFKVLSQILKTAARMLLDGSHKIYRGDFIFAPYPIMQRLQATNKYVATQRAEVWKNKSEAFMGASLIAELDKTDFIVRLSDAGR